MRKLVALLLVMGMVAFGSAVFAAQEKSSTMPGSSQPGMTQGQTGAQGMMTQDSFTQWDADQNRRLSPDEFRAHYKGQDAQDMFKSLDKDNDGYLSQQEFTRQGQQGQQRGY
jgi:hypothetical protein